VLQTLNLTDTAGTVFLNGHISFLGADLVPGNSTVGPESGLSLLSDLVGIAIQDFALPAMNEVSFVATRGVAYLCHSRAERTQTMCVGGWREGGGRGATHPSQSRSWSTVNMQLMFCVVLVLFIAGVGCGCARPCSAWSNLHHHGPDIAGGVSSCDRAVQR
jgi:hypothetical protein